MARKLKTDPVLFSATVLLLCISVVMVYSASAVMAAQRFHQPYLFLTKQAMWTLLGVPALWLAMKIDYRCYRNERIIWGLLALVGLMLFAVLFASPINGTRRWFGFGGLGIQPSELAKLACILFSALMLERRMHRINEFTYGVLPVVLVAVAMIGLIMLQPDFGTSVAILAIVGIMLFAAGLPYRLLAGCALVVLPALVALIYFEPYRVARITAFLDPEGTAQGAGFQLNQSLIAVGAGGEFGRGLMAGVQKLFYLPEPHTDFIFAVIGEELGLIGTTGVLICFGVIAWRGLRVALRAEDQFGSFIALGITAMVAVQALINMSVVLGLVPTKGIPLPLVSAGGSSLLINLLGMGVLLNVSQHEAPGMS